MALSEIEATQLINQIAELRVPLNWLINQYSMWEVALLVHLLFVIAGAIVSVGDPTKKYTKMEKIGQG